jgi:hypothetical protein
LLTGRLKKFLLQFTTLARRRTDMKKKMKVKKVEKEPESKFVRGSYRHLTDEFRKQVRREAEKYGRKLGFKSSRENPMQAQVKSEIRFWEQANEIDVYEAAFCGDQYIADGCPPTIVARLRALCGLDGLLVMEKSDLQWDELDTMDTCRTFLVTWYAKAAPPPATISLAEFAKRTGLSIEEVKHLKPENVAGFYVDDKGETRVDFARFERRFGIKEEQAA